MNYEEALKVWGANRLSDWSGVKVNASSVTVVTEFEEGYACCGGNNPDCYCSYAESPSASVVITSSETSNRCSIDLDDFDFAVVLGEIVAAGNGTLTL